MLRADAGDQALFIVSMSVSAGIALWALTDACNRDHLAFRRAGFHRMSWILLILAGCAVAVLGSPGGLLFAAAIGVDYLVRVRARVRVGPSPIGQSTDDGRRDPGR
jgi:hypothetical protein